MIEWNNALSALGIGVIFSVLAVLSERLLIFYGYVRGNTIGLIVASFFLAVFKQVLDNSSSLYIYGIFITIAGPIGVNRYDLVNTIRKGRWWWKSENDSKNN